MPAAVGFTLTKTPSDRETFDEAGHRNETLTSTVSTRVASPSSSPNLTASVSKGKGVFVNGQVQGTASDENLSYYFPLI